MPREPGRKEKSNHYFDDWIIRKIMKDLDVVLKRSIALLTFSDRCALEDSVIEGVSRSVIERENQRKAILHWLQHANYYDSLSEKEKNIFNTIVTDQSDIEIRYSENDHECIEPLLWAIGLVNRLTSYDKYVLTDFHPVLELGRNHTYSSLISKCNFRKEDEINKKREIAMLWYWRCLEARKNAKIGIKESVDLIFGHEYVGLLKEIKNYDYSRNDFVVNGKTISELDSIELQRLTIRAERRFYALEWLFSDDDWDEVDLVC